MVSNNMVLVDIDDLVGLCELSGRVQAFAAYVQNERYNVSREVCAYLLGFELPSIDEEQK